MSSLEPQDRPFADSPGLWHWFRQRQIERPRKVYEIFLMNLLRAVFTEGNESARLCVQGIDSFLRLSDHPTEDFLMTDSLAQELGKPVTEILSALAESGIRSGEGHRLFSPLQSLANLTNLSALRFLSAWTALNLGDLQTCIDECEREVEAHAPIHTLLGQALLESGRTHEAIDAFLVSLKLDTGDVLAMFQLIKAYLVLGRTNEAIPYALRCRELCGDNIEIECLAAMLVIADGAKNTRFAKDSLERLLNLFQSDNQNLDLMCLAFEVSEVQEDQRAASILVHDADFVGLAKSRDFAARMGEILGRLGKKGWYALSRQLTEKMLALNTGRSAESH